MQFFTLVYSRLNGFVSTYVSLLFHLKLFVGQGLLAYGSSCVSGLVFIFALDNTFFAFSGAGVALQGTVYCLGGSHRVYWCGMNYELIMAIGGPLAYFTTMCMGKCITVAKELDRRLKSCCNGGVAKTLFMAVIFWVLILDCVDTMVWISKAEVVIRRQLWGCGARTPFRAVHIETTAYSTCSIDSFLADERGFFSALFASGAGLCAEPAWRLAENDPRFVCKFSAIKLNDKCGTEKHADS